MMLKFSSYKWTAKFSAVPMAMGIALLSFALPLCQQKAMAQLDTQTAVVLDFEVFPGLDPNLGRKAADSLAVELQASTANNPVPRQRIEVVPRQLVLQIMNDTTALTPPYTDIIQLRLARATGASSVYWGRVLSATVSDRKAARVTLEVMQFDARMGDYSNGAVVSQMAFDKNANTDNDLLLDEAINKAVYAALIEIERSPFPVGTIQIVTREYNLINLGNRNGVARGQRYAVLRDIYRGRDTNDRDIVERIKIGEMIITRIDIDQASGLLTTGGGAGVKIGDKVRKIYVPSRIAQDFKDRDAERLKFLNADELKAQDIAAAARRIANEAERREMAAREVELTAQGKSAKKRKARSNNELNY